MFAMISYPDTSYNLFDGRADLRDVRSDLGVHPDPPHAPFLDVRRVFTHR